MGPIEVLYGQVAMIIALVAIARGYHRELGSTVVIIVSIFALSFFEAIIVNLFTRLAEVAFGISADQRNLFLSIAFQCVFLAMVFAGYAGKTFDFPGRPKSPPIGTLLSLLVGMLNGYLIAGTLWYYEDHFSYPLQILGLIQLPLTTNGTALLGYLPQKLFESPVYWMLPVAALILLRVRG